MRCGAARAPHLPLLVYLAVAGLFVAVIFVALTAGFNVLLVSAALGAAATAAARGAGVARLLAAALIATLLVAATTAFLVRGHF
jgi:hypothetical protein